LCFLWVVVLNVSKRIVLKLFDDKAPHSAKMFRWLCTGTDERRAELLGGRLKEEALNILSETTVRRNKDLFFACRPAFYQPDMFGPGPEYNREISYPGIDYDYQDSTYFSTSWFPPESSGLMHKKAGLLSMRRTHRGVQFLVTNSPAGWLDESRASWTSEPDPNVIHVVIGEVVSGMDVYTFDSILRRGGVDIVNCGEV